MHPGLVREHNSRKMLLHNVRNLQSTFSMEWTPWPLGRYLGRLKKVFEALKSMLRSAWLTIQALSIALQALKLHESRTFSKAKKVSQRFDPVKRQISLPISLKMKKHCNRATSEYHQARSQSAKCFCLTVCKTKRTTSSTLVSPLLKFGDSAQWIRGYSLKLKASIDLKQMIQSPGSGSSWTTPSFQSISLSLIISLNSNRLPLPHQAGIKSNFLWTRNKYFLIQ